MTRPLARRGSNAAFIAAEAGSSSLALYGWTSGSYHRLIDTSTPMPGGTGNFRDLWYTSIGGPNAALVARDDAGRYGLYTVPAGGGPITTIASPSTPIPGGVGNFLSMTPVGADGPNLTFGAGGSGGQAGIYAWLDGSLVTIVDRNTPAPGGGTFTDFFNVKPSISGHNILFEATSSVFGDSLWVWRNGQLSRVVSRFDVLGGIPVINFSVSVEGIDGDTIAFSFSGPGGPNVQYGLYTATYIPAPAGAYAVILGALGLLARRRRR